MANYYSGSNLSDACRVHGHIVEMDLVEMNRRGQYKLDLVYSI
jgi:hypothetical protein